MVQSRCRASSYVGSGLRLWEGLLAHRSAGVGRRSLPSGGRSAHRLHPDTPEAVEGATVSIVRREVPLFWRDDNYTVPFQNAPGFWSARCSPCGDHMRLPAVSPPLRAPFSGDVASQVIAACRVRPRSMLCGLPSTRDGIARRIAQRGL